VNAPAASLVLVLLLAAPIHWVKSVVIETDPDDVMDMTVSREIDSGAWRRLWTRHDVHFFPFYRLLRLPFDRHFPAWYTRFHAVLVWAHLTSAALLFLLARRYFEDPWAALVTALLFAWSTVGDQALVWKAVATFALSWTFLLGGAWCLTHRGIAWASAAGTLLLCAVGMFSGALFVLPGICVALLLLEPRDRRQAVYTCGAAWIAGALAWLIFVLPQLDLNHYWRYGHATAGPLARLWWAVVDVLLAYNYQLFLGVRLLSERHIPLLVAAIVTALILLRRQVNLRWILAAFAMTALPLFIMVLVRKEPEVWKVSRYLYQSYTFWAVVFGALLDGMLARLGPWPRRRFLVLAALPVLAALYWTGHRMVARYERAYFERQPATTQVFWFGWDSFFRFASAHHAPSSAPLALPDLMVAPRLDLRTVFLLCHPRGLPGLTLHAAGTAQERLEFWREVRLAQERLPMFAQVHLESQ